MAAVKPTVPQRSPRRSTLSRQAILDAAIALVERDGSAAPAACDAWAPSLASRAWPSTTTSAAATSCWPGWLDRLLEPLNDVDLECDWREACLRFATALRAVAVGRPESFRTVGLLPLDTPTSLRSVERLLGTLVEAGFSASDALAADRAVASYARGYALAEATGFTVDATSANGRSRLRALSADEFPVLHGASRRALGARRGRRLRPRAARPDSGPSDPGVSDTPATEATNAPTIGARLPLSPPAVSRWRAWLLSSQGLIALALVVGLGAGAGAIGFRYLIMGLTELLSGHRDYSAAGHAINPHVPWLGPWFVVLVPVVGGLLYGPLVARFAPEARGHGVPEVMLAVAEMGGRIRPQVPAVKALASALCIGSGARWAGRGRSCRSAPRWGRCWGS